MKKILLTLALGFGLNLSDIQAGPLVLFVSNEATNGVSNLTYTNRTLDILTIDSLLLYAKNGYTGNVSTFILPAEGTNIHLFTVSGLSLSSGANYNIPLTNLVALENTERLTVSFSTVITNTVLRITGEH